MRNKKIFTLLTVVLLIVILSTFVLMACEDVVEPEDPFHEGAGGDAGKPKPKPVPPPPPPEAGGDGDDGEAGEDVKYYAELEVIEAMLHSISIPQNIPGEGETDELKLDYHSDILSYKSSPDKPDQKLVITMQANLAAIAKTVMLKNPNYTPGGNEPEYIEVPVTDAGWVTSEMGNVFSLVVRDVTNVPVPEKPEINPNQPEVDPNAPAEKNKLTSAEIIKGDILFGMYVINKGLYLQVPNNKQNQDSSTQGPTQQLADQKTGATNEPLLIHVSDLDMVYVLSLLEKVAPLLKDKIDGLKGQVMGLLPVILSFLCGNPKGPSQSELNTAAEDPSQAVHFSIDFKVKELFGMLEGLIGGVDLGSIIGIDLQLKPLLSFIANAIPATKNTLKASIKNVVLDENGNFLFGTMTDVDDFKLVVKDKEPYLKDKYGNILYEPQKIKDAEGNLIDNPKYVAGKDTPMVNPTYDSELNQDGTPNPNGPNIVDMGSSIVISYDQDIKIWAPTIPASVDEFSFTNLGLDINLFAGNEIAPGGSLVKMDVGKLINAFAGLSGKKAIPANYLELSAEFGFKLRINLDLDLNYDKLKDPNTGNLIDKNLIAIELFLINRDGEIIEPEPQLGLYYRNRAAYVNLGNLIPNYYRGKNIKLETNLADLVDHLVEMLKTAINNGVDSVINPTPADPNNENKATAMALAAAFGGDKYITENNNMLTLKLKDGEALLLPGYAKFIKCLTDLLGLSGNDKYGNQIVNIDNLADGIVDADGNITPILNKYVEIHFGNDAINGLKGLIKDLNFSLPTPIKDVIIRIGDVAMPEKVDTANPDKLAFGIDVKLVIQEGSETDNPNYTGEGSSEPEKIVTYEDVFGVRLAINNFKIGFDYGLDTYVDKRLEGKAHVTSVQDLLNDIVKDGLNISLGVNIKFNEGVYDFGPLIQNFFPPANGKPSPMEGKHLTWEFTSNFEFDAELQIQAVLDTTTPSNTMIVVELKTREGKPVIITEKDGTQRILFNGGSVILGLYAYKNGLYLDLSNLKIANITFPKIMVPNIDVTTILERLLSGIEFNFIFDLNDLFIPAECGEYFDEMNVEEKFSIFTDGVWAKRSGSIAETGIYKIAPNGELQFMNEKGDKIRYRGTLNSDTKALEVKSEDDKTLVFNYVRDKEIKGHASTDAAPGTPNQPNIGPNEDDAIVEENMSLLFNPRVGGSPRLATDTGKVILGVNQDAITIGASMAAVLTLFDVLKNSFGMDTPVLPDFVKDMNLNLGISLARLGGIQIDLGGDLIPLVESVQNPVPITAPTGFKLHMETGTEKTPFRIGNLVGDGDKVANIKINLNLMDEKFKTYKDSIVQALMDTVGKANFNAHINLKTLDETLDISSIVNNILASSGQELPFPINLHLDDWDTNVDLRIAWNLDFVDFTRTQLQIKFEYLSKTLFEIDLYQGDIVLDLRGLGFFYVKLVNSPAVAFISNTLKDVVSNIDNIDISGLIMGAVDNLFSEAGMYVQKGNSNSWIMFYTDKIWYDSEGRSGKWNVVGDSVTYYEADGLTIIASGKYSPKDKTITYNNKIYLLDANVNKAASKGGKYYSPATWLELYTDNKWVNDKEQKGKYSIAGDKITLTNNNGHVLYEGTIDITNSIIVINGETFKKDGKYIPKGSPIINDGVNEGTAAPETKPAEPVPGDRIPQAEEEKRDLICAILNSVRAENTAVILELEAKMLNEILLKFAKIDLGINLGGGLSFDLLAGKISIGLQVENLDLDIDFFLEVGTVLDLNLDLTETPKWDAGGEPTLDANGCWDFTGPAKNLAKSMLDELDVSFAIDIAMKSRDIKAMTLKAGADKSWAQGADKDEYYTRVVIEKVYEPKTLHNTNSNVVVSPGNFLITLAAMNEDKFDNSNGLDDGNTQKFAPIVYAILDYKAGNMRIILCKGVVTLIGIDLAQFVDIPIALDVVGMIGNALAPMLKTISGRQDIGAQTAGYELPVAPTPFEETTTLAAPAAGAKTRLDLAFEQLDVAQLLGAGIDINLKNTGLFNVNVSLDPYTINWLFDEIFASVFGPDTIIDLKGDGSVFAHNYLEGVNWDRLWAGHTWYTLQRIIPPLLNDFLKTKNVNLGAGGINGLIGGLYPQVRRIVHRLLPLPVFNKFDVGLNIVDGTLANIYVMGEDQNKDIVNPKTNEIYTYVGKLEQMYVGSTGNTTFTRKYEANSNYASESNQYGNEAVNNLEGSQSAESMNAAIRNGDRNNRRPGDFTQIWIYNMSPAVGDTDNVVNPDGVTDGIVTWGEIEKTITYDAYEYDSATGAQEAFDKYFKDKEVRFQVGKYYDEKAGKYVDNPKLMKTKAVFKDHVGNTIDNTFFSEENISKINDIVKRTGQPYKITAEAGFNNGKIIRTLEIQVNLKGKDKITDVGLMTSDGFVSGISLHAYDELPEHICLETELNGEKVYRNIRVTNQMFDANAILPTSVKAHTINATAKLRNGTNVPVVFNYLDSKVAEVLGGNIVRLDWYQLNAETFNAQTLGKYAPDVLFFKYEDGAVGKVRVGKENWTSPQDKGVDLLVEKIKRLSDEAANKGEQYMPDASEFDGAYYLYQTEIGVGTKVKQTVSVKFVLDSKVVDSIEINGYANNIRINPYQYYMYLTEKQRIDNYNANEKDKYYFKEKDVNDYEKYNPFGRSVRVHYAKSVVPANPTTGVNPIDGKLGDYVINEAYYEDVYVQDIKPKGLVVTWDNMNQNIEVNNAMISIDRMKINPSNPTKPDPNTPGATLPNYYYNTVAEWEHGIKVSLNRAEVEQIYFDENLTQTSLTIDPYKFKYNTVADLEEYKRQLVIANNNHLLFEERQYYKEEERLYYEAKKVEYDNNAEQKYYDRLEEAHYKPYKDSVYKDLSRIHYLVQEQIKAESGSFYEIVPFNINSTWTHQDLFMSEDIKSPNYNVKRPEYKNYLKIDVGQVKADAFNKDDTYSQKEIDANIPGVTPETTTSTRKYPAWNKDDPSVVKFDPNNVNHKPLFDKTNLDHVGAYYTPSGNFNADVDARPFDESTVKLENSNFPDFAWVKFTNGEIIKLPIAFVTEEVNTVTKKMNYENQSLQMRIYIGYDTEKYKDHRIDKKDLIPSNIRNVDFGASQYAQAILEMNKHEFLQELYVNVRVNGKEAIGLELDGCQTINPGSVYKIDPAMIKYLGESPLPEEAKVVYNDETSSLMQIDWVYDGLWDKLTNIYGDENIFKIHGNVRGNDKVIFEIDCKVLDRSTFHFNPKDLEIDLNPYDFNPVISEAEGTKGHIIGRNYAAFNDQVRVLYNFYDIEVALKIPQEGKTPKIYKHVSEAQYKEMVRRIDGTLYNITPIAEYVEELKLPIVWDNIAQLTTNKNGQGTSQRGEAHLKISDNIKGLLTETAQNILVSERIVFKVNVLKKEVVSVNGMPLDENFVIEVPHKLLTPEEIAHQDIFYRVIVGQKGRGIDLTFSDGTSAKNVDAIIHVTGDATEAFTNGTMVYQPDGTCIPTYPVQAEIIIYPEMEDNFADNVTQNVKVHIVKYVNVGGN